MLREYGTVPYPSRAGPVGGRIVFLMVTTTALTPREAELLAITLDVLRERGFDRLTVDEVAARAHASKATVYRRWPSKADLVLAAFSHGVREVAKPPDTGSLRGDLLAIGELVIEQTRLLGTAITGILPELQRQEQLRVYFEHEFIHERRALILGVLEAAAARGEIRAAAINAEIWDVLPGYLVFRGLMPSRPATEQTLRALVDEVLLPSLTRLNSKPG
jgi:AcrR family transcriptional regulator